MAGETQATTLADFEPGDTGIPTDDAPEQEAPPDAQSEAPELAEGDEGDEGEAEVEDDEDDLLDDEPEAPSPDAELAAKWRELEASGRIPEEWLDRLVTAKSGDRTIDVTVREALSNYQRLNEHTRRSQELDARASQLEQNERHMGEFFQRIRDPDAFIEVFERQLGPEVFDAVVQKRIDRIKQDGEFIEAAGFAAMRRYGVDHTDPRVAQAMRDANERIQAERTRDIEQRQAAAKMRELEARARQTDEAKSVEQLRATFKHQLDQLVPTAFKANRIRDNPRNRGRLVDNLKVLMRQTGAAQITREIVQQAAQITREDLEDARAAQAPKGKASADKPRSRQGAGAGAAPTRGASKADRSKPKTLRDFSESMGWD